MSVTGSGPGLLGAGGVIGGGEQFDGNHSFLARGIQQSQSDRFALGGEKAGMLKPKKPMGDHTVVVVPKFGDATKPKFGAGGTAGPPKFSGEARRGASFLGQTKDFSGHISDPGPSSEKSFAVPGTTPLLKSQQSADSSVDMNMKREHKNGAPPPPVPTAESYLAQRFNQRVVKELLSICETTFRSEVQAMQMLNKGAGASSAAASSSSRGTNALDTWIAAPAPTLSRASSAAAGSTASTAAGRPPRSNLQRFETFVASLEKHPQFKKNTFAEMLKRDKERDGERLKRDKERDQEKKERERKKYDAEKREREERRRDREREREKERGGERGGSSGVVERRKER